MSEEEGLPTNLYIGRVRVEDGTEEDVESELELSEFELSEMAYAEAENESTRTRGWRHSGSGCFVAQLADFEHGHVWNEDIYVLPVEGKE